MSKNYFDSKKRAILSTSQITNLLQGKQLNTIANGKYTITNKNGNHTTIMIETCLVEKSFMYKKRYISVLIGNDNQNDYLAFGFVNDDKIVVWQKKLNQTITKNGKTISQYYEKLAKMVFTMATNPNKNAYLDMGLTIQVSKNCCLCNLELTNPNSIELGIGPICSKMVA